MNEKLLKKAILDALRLALGPGVTVIFADQNEPRPPRPYVTFKIMTGPLRAGHDWEDQEDAGFRLTGVRELSVSINYLGQDALEGMARIQTRLQWPSVRAILARYKLVFVSDSGIRDMSQLLETRTETRSQMDVELRLTVTDLDALTGTIEEAEFENLDTGSEFTISTPMEEP